MFPGRAPMVSRPDTPSTPGIQGSGLVPGDAPARPQHSQGVRGVRLHRLQIVPTVDEYEIYAIFPGEKSKPRESPNRQTSGPCQSSQSHSSTRFSVVICTPGMFAPKAHAVYPFHVPNSKICFAPTPRPTAIRRQVSRSVSPSSRRPCGIRRQTGSFDWNREKISCGRTDSIFSRSLGKSVNSNRPR